MKISLSVSLLTILLAGQVFASPPGAAESEYFISTGGGFMLVKGAPIYAMNFQIIKELPDGYRLEFQFQNPEESEQPLTETPILNIEGDSIAVQSAPLNCIRNGERYLGRVKIYAGET
ncbi:MAG: hypothetical protein IID59_01945, partial [Proteobacteria bacterium]|nr:hypothetical protein [Pseudomonadota bacterium]